MKTILGLLLVIGGLFAASTLIPNEYAECSKIGVRHGLDACKSKKKPVVKVVKKPSIKIFGLSVKELEALALVHPKNQKLQGRIERRIMFLKNREKELKQVRKEIEYGALKSEFARLKFVRENYNIGSHARNLINDTLRAIQDQIKKFEKENPVVKPVSRKPAEYVEHAGKRAIAVLKLKREIRILIMQYNQATGIHKKRLERTIESLQRELSVVIGKIEECK